ncbi:MAG: hypothetical protein E7812_13840 [Phenylobacterium sp.]|nr:MAG: hypothetical protein E7812_13840 [Phenylobacterium sp.]
MHLFIIPAWFDLLFDGLVAALAVWKGGWRERAIAVVQLVLFLLEDRFCDLRSCRPLIPWPSVITDGLILAVCLICAVRADRYWTLWACSFGLLALVSDFAAFIPGVTPWAWLSATLIWSYMLCAAVLWGVWTTARDRARLPAT